MIRAAALLSLFVERSRWRIDPRVQAAWENFLNASAPEKCEYIQKLREWLCYYEQHIGRSEDFEGTIGKPMLSRLCEREAELKRRIKELEDMEWALKVYAQCEAEADVADDACSSGNRKVDAALLAGLTSACANVSVVGYIYFKRWSMPDGTAWYKVGVTTNPRRRDAEQNVLPVAAETLAPMPI